MTTAKAIALLAQQIENDHASLDDFPISGDLFSEFEICDEKHAVNIRYYHIGEGKIEHIEVSFLRYRWWSREWVKGSEMGVNIELLKEMFEKLMLEHYNYFLEKSNELEFA